MSSSARARGFTLIEVLIVVLFLGVFAVVATDTFSNIMKTQNKVRVLNELGQSGSYALSIMEQQLRNADEITCCGGDFSPACGSGGYMGNEAVGFKLGGEEICFCIWPTGGVRAIMRSVGADCASSCTPPGDDPSYSFLTDTDQVGGVNIGEASFSCDSGGTRVNLKLGLMPPPNSPTRQDFQAGDGVVLETTVNLRGAQ